MIKIENTEIVGWEASVRGMRNPMNSWEKSDSTFYNEEKLGHTISGNLYFATEDYEPVQIGPKDHYLMSQLASNGPVHAKYRRMITVYADVTAPLYWWKEFDTYKIGTVANSCSTMHKIHSKEFTIDDFSHEHLFSESSVNGQERLVLDGTEKSVCAEELLQLTVNVLNFYRKRFLETKEKDYWWQLIQLLPSSYNQRRTIMTNYEVLTNINRNRKDHKLDEWRDFCKWILNLPYSEFMI